MKRADKNILLINPNRMKPVVAPIALDYIAHSLKINGYDVDVLDLSSADEPEKEISSYFRNPAPLKAIGITVRNLDDSYVITMDFFPPMIKRIIDKIKLYTGTPVVLGGTGFSIMPGKMLEYCNADFGIFGDGEEAFLMLLENMDNTGEYRNIPGLVYRSEGKVVVNTRAAFNLRGFTPRRSFVDTRKFFEEGGMGGFETKRGCPRECIYCIDPLCKGNVIRIRTPESVVDEIEDLLGQGINYFHTCDSEFNLPYNHSMEICREIIRRGLGDNIKWYAYLSPVPFTGELASAMKQAGCKGINFGVDSGSNAMLKALGRDYDADALEKTGYLCRKNEIVFMFDLLVGGPGETKQTINETVELMRVISPDRVGLAPGVRVYEGTELAEIVKSEGPMVINRNLVGKKDGNDDFFEPVFYSSSEIGEDIYSYIASMVRNDKRFFLPAKEEKEKNYNYNDNSVLVQAIKAGYRGAFWDILRRLSDGEE